ncbi:SdpI family protein [Flaviaesturariibacter terrae]
MRVSVRIANLLAGYLLLLCWILVIRSYSSLPATVPIHFDAAGRADDWGPRSSVWMLPVIASAAYALLTLLHRYAHRFPRKPQDDTDPERALELVRRLFRQLRLVLMLVLATATFYSLRAAKGLPNPEPSLPVLLILLLLATPTLLFLYGMLRAPRKPRNEG